MHKLYDFYKQKLECYWCSTEKQGELSFSTFAARFSNFEVTPIYPCKRACTQQGLNLIELYFILFLNPHIDHIGVTSITHAAEAS